MTVPGNADLTGEKIAFESPGGCLTLGTKGEAKMTLTMSVQSSMAGRVFHYNVRGLERGVSIAITGRRSGWQIYRWDGLGWRGHYSSAEEALAVLQRETI
jgi:hypothetical protein